MFLVRLPGVRAAMLVATAALLLLGAGIPALAQSTPEATPAVSAPGINVADMDLAVSPRDDFYRFANGGWLDRTEIPPDRSLINTLQQLRDQTIDQQVALLQAGDAPPGSDQEKAVTVFAQGLDMDERDRQGIAPIQDAIDRIDAIDSAAAYHAYLARAPFDGVNATLTLQILPDFNDSTTYALNLGEPALGLPNRDYYLEDNPSNEAIRQAYIANATALLTAAGYDAESAAAAAGDVYAFEKTLAAATMTREEQQDFVLQNNPTTLAELNTAYPALDWSSFLAALGAGDAEQVIVNDPGYLAALPAIMADTPIETLRAYLMVRLLSAWADALSSELGETAFAFQQALTGQEAQAPLSERVLAQVNTAVPDAVGQLYVAAYFPPEAKAAIDELAHNVLDAFGERLATNTWMTPETKTKAREKLDAVTVKVGYPDTWIAYDPVVPAASFAGSLRSALEFNQRREFAKAGNPVDRGEWYLTAQTVNAQYNPFGNEIVFPAAILQPPFFDYQADDASNYGAIGFVIGHEITHGFDLTGSQFDPAGNLQDWWTNVDRQRFLALNDALAAQYSAIAVAPDLFVNGQITIGENAADLGGIQNAYAALQTELAAEGAAATPVASDAAIAPPFTPPQRFFFAASSVWRNKTRPAFLELQVRSDEHAPGIVRSTQPLRNTDAFFSAFGMQPDDPMWLAPEERIVIW